MIIDCHCHAGRGDILTAPWNTDAPLGKYLRRARRAGIERTVVFPAFCSDYASANEELARIVARSRGRLIGFAMVHAARDAGRMGEIIGRAVRQHGFRGVKVHGHDAMPTRELCDVVRALRVPMLLDVGGKAQVLEMLAPQYPEIAFIIPHLGSFADDWQAHQRLIDQMLRFPNLYADTSGVRRFDYLVQAVARVGSRRILFGSDGPWLHPGLELGKIRLLGLARARERLILGENLARLIGLELTSGRPFTQDRRATRKSGQQNWVPQGNFVRRKPLLTRPER